jgi:hypothetical protein
LKNCLYLKIDIVKNKKLFALMALITVICLLSIAAGFKQCKGFTAAGWTTPENASVDMNQTSENVEITGENITANSGVNETSSGISTVSSGKTDPGTESNTEMTVAKTTLENGGQNGQAIQKYAIIISGASYNKQHYNWFLSSTVMAYKLLRNNGYEDESIYYLFEDKNVPDVDSLSTMNNFKKAVLDIKSRSGITDSILVILIGHGGFDGSDSYYCLSDNNLYDTEMADMFKDIKRDKLIFIFSPCNSGGFIDNLSGNNTVIITSTRKDEVNRAAFIEPFLAAFDGPGDSDLNGKISFAEAFNFASASVKQQFADNGWGGLTEHAQIDDNGDKISTEYLFPDEKDGELAGQIFLK